MRDIRDFARWGFDHYGWSKATRANYSNRVVRANKWFLESLGKPLAKASCAEVERYFFSSAVKATPQNRKSLRYALIRYFEWIGRNPNPAKVLPCPKIPKRLPRALRQQQGRRIIEDSHCADVQVQLFVALWIYQGFRFSESRLLRWDCVRTRYFHFPGKGDKDRCIGIHPIVRKLLNDWRRDCACPEWVFPSPIRHGRPISGTSIRSRVYPVLGKARPHTLRHTFATTSLKQKALDVRQLQEVLGHGSLATTEIYLRVWPSEIADGISKLTY